MVALGLAAVLVSGVSAAVIGSRQKDPSVVPPPSDAVLPSPTATPTSIPSDQSSFQGEIQLQVAGGGPLTLSVTDTTGALVGAESGTPGDGASVERGKVAVGADPANPNVLIATWTGSPCESRASMLVDEGT